MNASTSYPKKEWESHAVKYFNTKQKLAMTKRNIRMMNNMENKYRGNSLSGQDAYEHIKQQIFGQRHW